MKVIYTAAGPFDGAMMRELLNVNGIRAEVYDRSVWLVHDADEARAARILGGLPSRDRLRFASTLALPR